MTPTPTPTPLDAKPQGAQSPDQLREIAIGLLHPSGRSLSDKETAGYINDLAEAAERIEKLERALADERHHREENLRMGNEAMDHAERLMAERDTALRALAEARRDALRYRFWRENIGMIEDDEAGITGVAFSHQIPILDPRNPDAQPPYSKGQMMDIIADGYIDAARQPETKV